MKFSNKIPCYLSLKECKEKIYNVTPFSSLTVVSIPIQKLICELDEYDEHDYFFKEDILINPWQIQYSLLINSVDDFYIDKREILINPLYQSLCKLCCEDYVKKIAHEIAGIYASEQTNSEKDDLIESLRKANNLDIFLIYQILSSKKFTSAKDNLLTQCIINILVIFSEPLGKKLKSKLISTYFPEFPYVISEIFLQYYMPTQMDKFNSIKNNQIFGI